MVFLLLLGWLVSLLQLIITIVWIFCFCTIFAFIAFIAIWTLFCYNVTFIWIMNMTGTEAAPCSNHSHGTSHKQHPATTNTNTTNPNTSASPSPHNPSGLLNRRADNLPTYEGMTDEEARSHACFCQQARRRPPENTPKEWIDCADCAKNVSFWLAWQELTRDATKLERQGTAAKTES